MCTGASGRGARSVASRDGRARERAYAPAGSSPAAPAALARRGVPALGGRSRRGGRPPPARCPARRARRPDLRRARPVPHGRHRARGGPAVPWAGTFLETNVRLYSVDAAGRRGVVFLSLDADRAVAVAAARGGFGLPYRWSRMQFTAEGAERRYTTQVRWPGPAASATSRSGWAARLPTAHWSGSSRPAGGCTSPGSAAPGSCPTPTRRGRCAPPRCWPSTTAWSPRPGWAASPGTRPDHVVFSDGVAATFGPPVLVTRP